MDDGDGWELEEDGSGQVRHRHGDVTAVAFLYSNLERVWAECTMCQAELDLDAAGMPTGWATASIHQLIELCRRDRPGGNWLNPPAPAL